MKRCKRLLGLVSYLILAGTGISPLYAEQGVQWVENDHYYQAVAVSTGITWADAQADAVARGGYLATATTSNENLFLYGLVADTAYWGGDNGPWLGGWQPEGSPEPGGNWQWISGEAWGFEAWSSIEPNNTGGTEDRVQFWKQSSSWNDKPHVQNAFGYVVEYQIYAGATGDLQVAIGGDGFAFVGTALDLTAILDGTATRVTWDLDGSSSVTNSHFLSPMWDVSGDYDVVLGAYNETYPGGVFTTQTIHVLTFEQATIHVTPTGNDANDGSSWASAKATIQAGVDAQMFEHGLVLVSNGTYTVMSEIVVDKAVTVQSVNGPAVTIVDGGGNNRCFNLGASACMISGFNITNGYAEFDGGGITCGNTTPVITNCIIIGNAAGDEGGGVNMGTLHDCTVEDNWAVRHGGGLNNGIAYDCTFSSNTASNNGGGAEWSDLYDCLLVDNVATNGGGIEGGSASGCTFSNNTALVNGGGGRNGNISHCVFRSNTAGDSGGGTHGGTAANSQISENTAKYGGGARATDMSDCEVSDNHATLDGGGVFGSASVLYSCNIYSNTANRTGGGIIYSYVHESAIHGNYSDRSGGGMKSGTAYDCVLSENMALETGGGMQDSTLYDCLVAGNQTLLYGGGGVQGSASRVYGCVITGNIAKTVGGGGASGAELFNCLVMDNESSSRGGGLNDCKAVNCTIMGNRSNLGGGVSFGTNPARTVHNSIIYGNSASTSSMDIYMYNRTEAGTFNSCSPDLVHGVDGNITDTPLVLSDGHLLPNSPCIGAGVYSNAVDTDIDGEAWLNPPSMGCDEYPGAGAVFGELTVALAVSSVLVEDIEVPLAGQVEGAVNLLVWDFGDGEAVTNKAQVVHSWNAPGTYSIVLTAYNDSFPAGVAATQTIQIVSREEATIHVSPTGNDANDGSSWESAKATIQAGVDAQQYDYGHVLVSNGTYSVMNEIVVNKILTVQSVGGPEFTLVDGGGTNRCFNLGSSECVISGFTITNGYSFREEGGGGGLYCSDTTPVVSNCVIIGCSSHGDAGGVRGGTVCNSELCYNISSWFGSGGGAYLSTLYNSSIHHNQSTGRGGGVADCPLYNCTVSANRASGSGGGAWYNNGNFEVRNSIIYENRTAGIQQKEITVNSGSLEELDISGSCSPELLHGIDGNITNSPELASCWNLSPQSPCRRSGSFHAVGTDFDGELWLNPPSMGCDEYLGSGTVTGALNVDIAGYFSATVGHQIDLEARINGSATTHIWNFGDGLIVSNIPVAAHTWESPGSYNVVLTAYNDTWSGGVSATQLVRVVSEESIILWEETGHYYQSVMVPDKLSWKEAKAEAASRGGYLATADTSAENDFIYSLVQSTNYWNGVGPWLGGFQPVGSMEPDGNWQWISGAPVVEPNWNLGEPNDSNGGQNRICFWAHSTRWDDNVDTARSGAYVIEYQIHPSAAGSLSVEIDGDEDIVAGATLELIGILDGLTSELVWDFGDGNTITNIQMPTHAWLVPGNYDVVLTAVNADNPGGVSATQTIHVLSLQDTTIHVALGGNNGNDGLCWETAKATIQGGVDAAIEGGVVLVSNGTYAVTNEIVVGKNITVKAVAGADATIIDGGGVSRCFQLGGDVCTISGFTMTNGYSALNGGAVLCLDTSHIISNCVITGSVTDRFGGGVIKGTLYNCKLVENRSTYRSGGAQGSVLYNSLVYSNTAANNFGGLSGCDAFNCTVVNNQTDGNGGGVNNCTVINCIIVDNTATKSGDNLYGSNTVLTNSCSPDITLSTAGNIIGVPLFVDGANSDFRLLSISPCINWGRNADVAVVNDLDGNPRIVEGHVDMGCYEFQGIIGKADTDEDGLLDTWERRWFGGNVLPENNADGDRQSNGAEYVSGSDPTNSTSFFKSSVTKSDAENGHFIIDWTTVSGRVYNVYWAPSLMEDFQPLEIGIQYPVNSYTDLVHSAESSGYYRVVVMRADYDIDGDGLPNDWESQYAVADAFADGDHDGYNNLAEFISGTDPTKGNSFFKAANAEAEVNGTTYFVVEWVSIPDRLYSVQWSANLASGFQTLETGIEYPLNSYTDTVHAVEESGYYNVEVELK